MTILSENVGGHGSFGPPGYAYGLMQCFQPEFRKWMPGVPPKQTEIAWDEIRNHSCGVVANATFTGLLQKVGHLDHWIGFHEQRKYFRKVPLQQMVEKRWSTV